MDTKNTIKHDKFRKFAEYRVNQLLRRIKIVGNLANRSAYQYTEEEVNKIFSTIERSLRDTKAKFHFSSRKEFKL